MRWVRNKGRSLLKVYTDKSHKVRNPKIQDIQFPLTERQKYLILKTKETLVHHKGVYQGVAIGLSAPQVGLRMRFFIMASADNSKNIYNRFRIVCNPRIISSGIFKSDHLEGVHSFFFTLFLV